MHCTVAGSRCRGGSFVALQSCLIKSIHSACMHTLVQGMDQQLKREQHAVDMCSAVPAYMHHHQYRSCATAAFQYTL